MVAVISDIKNCLRYMQIFHNQINISTNLVNMMNINDGLDYYLQTIFTVDKR